jgi:hypothetical protein
LLSCSIALVGLLAAPAAHADDPGSIDSRHQIGIQAGGSGFFLIDYRLRLLGPVYLDAGAFGLPPDGVADNFSLGLVFALRRTTRFFPYAGFGVGFAVFGGPAEGCDPSKSDCPNVGDALSYVYGRVGVGLALDAARRHTLGLDFGGWYGEHQATKVDGTAMLPTTTTTPIRWPMAGLSYFYRFRP